MPVHPTPITVSICIASYNYDQYIGEAIESVFAQSCEDWELIVVDDASTDNSVAVITKLQQRHPDKVTFIPSSSNHGVCYTFNLAFSKARGEFIAMLGADDRMLPQRLEKQLAAFENQPKLGVVCTDVLVIGKDGGPTKYDLRTFSKPIYNLRMQLLEGNFLNAASAMFRKCILDEVGYLNPMLTYVQDFEHWLRILEQYDIKRLPQKLTEYRYHGKNLSVQASGEHAYAGRYETAMVIFNTIRRRDEQISKDQLTDQQIIDEKLFLANAAIKAEKMFLGSFKYAVSLVYGLVLDILVLDSDHQQAMKFLNMVYSALGDAPRSLGNKPISDNELTVLENDRDERTLYQIAVDTHEQTGASLAQIVESILQNETDLISAQMKKDQTGNSEQLTILTNADRRNYFCANLVEHIINQAELSVDYSAGKSFHKKIRGELNESLAILDEGQTLANNDPVAQALKDQIREILDNDRYQVWIRKHELREVDAEIIAERMTLTWKKHPVIHCVLFLLPGEEPLLADTIDSLAAQLYSKWQLTVIASIESPDPIFDQADNLHWTVIDEQLLPYEVINREISHINADWTIFIEPGTRFEVHTFAKIAEYINQYPNWSFIYTDDDLVDNIGMRHSPRFKPDFNLDLLRSSPYIGCAWMRTQELISAQGIRQLPGAEHYDLAMRWLDNYGESAIGHISDILIHHPQYGDRVFDSNAGMLALQEHLERNSINSEVHQGHLDNSYRVEYLHADQPAVTVIIPTKDKLEFFQPCIESLLEKTTYPNFEVIVIDNQSTDPDTLAYYDLLTEQYQGKVKIVYYEQAFNFSAMINFAAQKATGDYLLLLNNDTEIIQPEWLSRMMSYGQRSDVGIVGARLVFPTTGKVQHVGVILGLNVISDHHYLGQLSLQDKGHMGRAQLDQNYSAVTAAALLIKKRVYQQVDGMDAEHLPVLYNGVDLCLKVDDLGYKILWTPHVTIVHHGDTSVEKQSAFSLYTDYSAEADKKIATQGEQRVMLERWLPRVANDPAYNKNLTLSALSFSVDTNSLQNWDVNIRSRLHCFGVPISKGGSGYYRIHQPFNLLSRHGLAQCEVGEHHLTITEVERMKPDSYVFQNAIKDVEIDNIRMMNDYHPTLFKVFSLDDLLHDLPESSSQYRRLKAGFRDMKTRIRRVLKYCDRLIVSTQPLADLCATMIDDICIIPNRLEGAVWLDLQSKREQSNKPRVGWAGAQQHQGDLEIIFDVVKETADKVDWIFMGMCPDEIRPYVKEYHEFVTTIGDYPEALASLNLDLAVAPLELHPFNEAKSNLRILEYGILAWPVICTDILPYQSYDAPVVRVANDKQAWIDAILQAVSSTTELQDSGDKLRQWVIDNFILEDHLPQWLDALKRPSTKPS